MFDLGWTEMLVVGVVALIVVGPKDLPVMFRTVGRAVGKAKGMAREFSSAMNDAADQSGIKDISKGLKAASNPVGSAMDGVRDAAQDMAKSMDFTGKGPGGGKIDPESETGKMFAERAEDSRKIRAATARAAAERKAAEAAEALAKADEIDAEVATNDVAPTPDDESKA